MVTDPIKFVYKVGDGVTTDFSYAYNGTVGFDADVAEDVRAAILNPDGTRDTNPNFAVMQDTYGNFIGKIRFAVAPVANAIIYIYRATPQTQETEYKTSSGFDAQNVEKDFDKLTKLVQETASHTRNKTLQLDMFQEAVLKLILTSSENQNQMLFIDFENLTFKFTDFTKGQAVITPAAGSDDKTDIMLTHLTDEDTGLPYLAFSLDQGATWKPMNFAEISAIVNSANAKAQEALTNSEQAVATANEAKNTADGIDGKATSALTNSEQAVATANAAKNTADGIDAKAQEALDNSETAVSTANDAKAVADGIDAKINDVQGDVDTLNTKVPSNASASNKMATAAEISTLQNQIEALQGAGGALNASNFNTATPTQETLTKYAVDQIWPGNTNWAWNAANPAASTFTSADGVSRTAAEIFNSTWVNNTYDDHRWQLTNTQNTTPKVFEWADVGRDIVSVATATTAGIVRVGSGSQMVVNPTTGDISLDGAKAESIRGTIGAVATNQGTANAGKILTVGDDGNIELASGASGAGRNIGDIFWTTRTDSALNGAVEANGAQYNFADVNQGQNNVQALLVSGALPSVPIAEFDSKVASDGGCDSFGYGIADLVLYPVYIYTVMSEGIQFYTNVLDWTSVQKDSNDVLQGVKIYDKNTYQELVGWYVKYDTSLGLYYIYNQEDEKADADVGDGYMPDSSDTVTSPTGGEFQSTTYFKVPKKLGRVLVRSQKPTADNDYTWYNLYADGWVEQGGIIPAPTTSNTGVGVILPIKMRDTNYHKLKTLKRAKDGNQNMAWGWYADCASKAPADTATTAYFSVAEYSYTQGAFWQVSGYANPAEYTKDKWDYQNVQVERPMVQLFNSATDEAVAQCTEVLSDVAGLKLATDGMIDYVVETQEPTAENGYTWYRLYKSGWVEQGGCLLNAATGAHTITIPIEMASVEDLKKSAITTPIFISGTIQAQGVSVRNSDDASWSTTQINCFSWGATIHIKWQVSGQSAQGSN